MQSELEDLCFAILHPDCYKKLHEERNRLWSLEPAVITADADKLLDTDMRPLSVRTPLPFVALSAINGFLKTLPEHGQMKFHAQAYRPSSPTC